MSASPVARDELPFRSVICFGSVDWWYHNRGHFDIRIMRWLARRAPVLYVNSLGMRFPRIGEGPMFFRRVARKLRSMRRPPTEAAPGFHVWSPPSAPGPLGRLVPARALAAQVERVARRVLPPGPPLLWVSTPTAWRLVPHLERGGLIYNRTDRYEAFPDVDVAQIAACDDDLKREADLTVFCGQALFEVERSECRRAAFVDHGVDLARFAPNDSEPEDLRGVPRPRAGFVGAIDPHTFDHRLLGEAAALLPDVHFVLIGGNTIPRSELAGPNVVLLGKKRPEEVARYLPHFDVLLMPWQRNEWIEFCNPVKLKEYLAAGRPVVSTPFRELERYAGAVSVAPAAEGFAARIREAFALDPAETASRQRARVADDSWERQGERVLGLLGEVLT